MGKQNKRKSGEGVTAASPKKIDAPKTPKKDVATPKKVKIQGESPMQAKNKPMKTPIKHKAPKSPAGDNVTPKKQNKVAKKKPAATNGAAKKSPKPKITLLPQDLSKKLNRRQKKRIVHKIAQVMKQKGKEDLTNVDPTDASIKEIVEKLVKKDTTGTTQGNKSDKTKAKVVKQIEDETEGDDSQEKATPVQKTPKKKAAPKKTPKASPAAK